MNITAIRIKCAEIVGWTYIEQLAFTGIPKGSRGNADARVIPAFTESADAALELVEWMAKPENGERTVVIDNNTRYWTAFIHSCGRKNHSDFSNTFPLAVCLAFLRANNIDPETL